MNGKTEEPKVGEWPRLRRSLETGERRDSPSLIQQKHSTPQFYHYLDSHPSSGWHTYQIFHSFLSGNRVIFCVSLMHVGFSGLKSSELSQLNPNRTSQERKSEGTFGPDLVCIESLKLRTREFKNILVALKYRNDPGLP